VVDSISKYIDDFERKYAKSSQSDAFTSKVIKDFESKAISANFAKDVFEESANRTLEVEESITFKDVGAAASGGENLNEYERPKWTTVKIRGYASYEDGYMFRGFNSMMRQISKKTNDLRSLWRVIRKDFYETNEEERFSQMGSNGPFKDLSITYQSQKRKHNNVYPILVLSGRLRDSLTKQTDENAYFKIRNTSVEFGTKVEYASDHQNGALLSRKGGGQNVLPMRRPVSIGSVKRAERWRGYVNTFISSLDKRGFYDAK